MSSATCRLADLRDRAAVTTRVDGEDVVVVRQGDEVYALADTCSHAEVSLAQGEVEDGTIECWLHGSRFDLRTGEALEPPAWEPVQTYDTEIVRDSDGEPVVRITARSNATPPAH